MRNMKGIVSRGHVASAGATYRAGRRSALTMSSPSSNMNASTSCGMGAFQTGAKPGKYESDQCGQRPRPQPPKRAHVREYVPPALRGGPPAAAWNPADLESGIQGRE